MCKPHVSDLNCRGFAFRSATDRSFTHARKNVTRVRSEVKSTVRVRVKRSTLCLPLRVRAYIVYKFRGNKRSILLAYNHNGTETLF